MNAPPTSPPCRVCAKSEPVLCYPDDHALTICPACCAKAEHPNGETGHCFEYSRGDRDHACTECGIFRNCTDWQYEPSEDDVPIMTATEFRGGAPLGTPMSEVSGRVVPWDHPDYPKYVEFCRIARSWGHE